MSDEYDALKTENQSLKRDNARLSRDLHEMIKRYKRLEKDHKKSTEELVVLKKKDKPAPQRIPFGSLKTKRNVKST